MPLMKSNEADKVLGSAIVLDLGDIGRQADQLKAAAKRKAEAIIAEAERRADELATRAHDEAFEAGRVEGLEQGNADGLKQGTQKAMAEARQQFQQLQAAWQQAADDWDEQRQTMQRLAQETILRFALRFAERIVHRVVEVDRSVIVDQLAAALAYVLKPTAPTVRIHGDDRSSLEEAMPDLLAQFNQIESLELVEDAQIERGGCVVCYGQGRIDATVQTQLDRLVRSILPDEMEQVQSNDGPDGTDEARRPPAESDEHAG